VYTEGASVSRLNDWPVAVAPSPAEVQAQRAEAAALLAASGPPAPFIPPTPPTLPEKRRPGRPRKEVVQEETEEYRQAYAVWLNDCKLRKEYIAACKEKVRTLVKEKALMINQYNASIIEAKNSLKEAEDWPAPAQPTRQK
jgi:hypothetical protein